MDGLSAKMDIEVSADKNNDQDEPQTFVSPVHNVTDFGNQSF